MKYYDLYNQLKTCFDNCTGHDEITSLGIKITKYNFCSEAAEVLPGAFTYKCPEHNTEFICQHPAEKEHPLIDYHDIAIDNNKNFQYSVISPLGVNKTNGVIFLFHGLNEKKWHKYLPWAYELVKQTGKSVILFPIAFHMERAPNSWSEFRLMKKVSVDRSANTSNSHSSFVNAAISARLEADPQRIFWSGFQTYMDFCAALKQIRQGGLKEISQNASVDFFGYSIGSFFCLILMLANPDNELKESRFFSFCGGATLDRMFPVSKYIMDFKASLAVASFFEEQLNTNFVNEKRLAHYMNGLHPEQSNFTSLLNYKFFMNTREERISKIAERIYAIALKQDVVVPPHEVLNTLQGALRDIPAKVEIMDFEYPYNHVTPFPVDEKYQEPVNDAFNNVMQKACRFLS